MKELSIEQKARRYDEAIKKAESLYKAAEPMSGCNVIIETLFPELADSKDERIRKTLIGCVSIEPSTSFEHGFSKEEILAWLEKQGEQKPAEWSNICEFSLETWNDIVAYVLKEHNGIGNYLDDPEVRDTAKRLQEKYKFDCASEEWDRVYRKGLDAGVNYGKAEALRVQAPVEWSDEDENHVKSILSTIECCKAQFPYAQAVVEAYNADIEWLKSLRPQNRWKVVDKKIYVKEPALVQKKDKSEPCQGFVICYDHTLTPDVYERYMMLSDIVSQNTWKLSGLPHWQKSNLPNHTTTGFNSDYFCHKGYCINYKELFDKLPKDD